MTSASRARVACQWKAKPRISTTKPVVADSVTVSAVSDRQAASASARRCTTAIWPCAGAEPMHGREGRRAVGERDLQHAGRGPQSVQRLRWSENVGEAAAQRRLVGPRDRGRHAVAGQDADPHRRDDDAVGIGQKNLPARHQRPGRDDLLELGSACGGRPTPDERPSRSARNSALPVMPRTTSAIAWRRWSKTCTKAPMQIVTRNAMMSAGTARRSAGSAVNRRRYAGLAIDCARPFDGIGTDRRARRLDARHAWPPFGSSRPDFDRKDVPHLPESLCIGVEM